MAQCDQWRTLHVVAPPRTAAGQAGRRILNLTFAHVGSAQPAALTAVGILRGLITE